MTISIENRENSGMALLEIVGEGMVPFCFPNEKVKLEPETRKRLVRVPVPDSSRGSEIIPIEDAREDIPIWEAMGRNLDAYDIESLPEGQSGKVNGLRLELGVPVDDQGIFFIGG